MSQPCFDTLNVIKTPVWLISPVSEQIIFANGTQATVSSLLGSPVSVKEW